MSPNETLFLESTNKIVKDDINNSSFVQFQIWDFPGQIDFFDPTFDSDMIFGGCGALVFVIDAQLVTIVDLQALIEFFEMLDILDFFVNEIGYLSNIFLSHLKGSGMHPYEDTLVPASHIGNKQKRDQYCETVLFCYDEKENLDEDIVDEMKERPREAENTDSDSEEEIKPTPATLPEARKCIEQLRQFFLQKKNEGSPLDALVTCSNFVNAKSIKKESKDDYIEALHKLNLTVTKAYKVNPKIIFEVFIHKVDGLGDDCKMETQRDIHQRANDELNDAGYDQIHLSLHLTSIYDHSIFEAFSKVVQKLIPQLPALENLLNILNTNSAIEKSFLFDVVSKIYIATDSTPVDMQSYELCCDMIDVVIDVSWIYGIKEDQDAAAFDDQSSSLIKLNNGTVLYLREVNKFLALVCILREDNFDHKGIIDYNFLCFREAIQQVFELRNKLQHNSTTNSVGSPMVNGKNSLGDGHLSPTLTDENN
ncbi:hypothetical protein MML48_1g14569 [Holotrichia oblita]|uniref:Uncharacterized protein n=2 Tax=Holotrichia oblita TaxID=644536 RepID=A0ACB9TSI6_HOLOL|nr:hypothetical protein MML48_1g14569 [Holotrichia oblita]